MAVIILLGVLFIALLVIVPLIERSGFRMSGQQMQKISRWILPLCIVLALIQLFRHLSA